MKKNILIYLFLASTLSAFAQTADEAGVNSVIKQLFLGMEKSDSAMVRTAFTPEVTMATVFRDKDNNAMMHRESTLDGFLNAVGTPHKEIWYEEIWDVELKIDGDFAQAWCDYAFYIDNTFSHCGVDAFHLIKQKDGWKIFHLADTRRKQNCDIPKAIQDKHKTK